MQRGKSRAGDTERRGGQWTAGQVGQSTAVCPACPAVERCTGERRAQHRGQSVHCRRSPFRVEERGRVSPATSHLSTFPHPLHRTSHHHSSAPPLLTRDLLTRPRFASAPIAFHRLLLLRCGPAICSAPRGSALPQLPSLPLVSPRLPSGLSASPPLSDLTPPPPPPPRPPLSPPPVVPSTLLPPVVRWCRRRSR